MTLLLPSLRYLQYFSPTDHDEVVVVVGSTEVIKRYVLTFICGSRTTFAKLLLEIIRNLFLSVEFLLKFSSVEFHQNVLILTLVSRNTLCPLTETHDRPRSRKGVYSGYVTHRSL